MKFATMVLYSPYVGRSILKNIQNSGPYVDIIYVSVGNVPWSYTGYVPPGYNTNLDFLNESKFKDKIRIIRGNWKLEEDQGNEVVMQARKDQVDYLITHDADEFYTNFSNILNGIQANHRHDFYTTPWCSFWKSTDYVIKTESDSIIVGYPEIAINITNRIVFDHCRVPASYNKFQLDELCYHTSFVLSNDECWDKINTWGHSNQFNRHAWFHNKWLNWTEESIDLHPLNPPAWKRATRHSLKLPKELL